MSLTKLHTNTNENLVHAHTHTTIGVRVHILLSFLMYLVLRVLRDIYGFNILAALCCFAALSMYVLLHEMMMLFVLRNERKIVYIELVRVREMRFNIIIFAIGMFECVV